MATESLRGIVTPLVTPLLDRDRLDREGLERLLAHVLDNGVHGLFVLGTTGEAPALSSRLKREVVRETIDLAGSRVPILVGVSDTSMTETLALARDVADMGANAIVATTPYYLPLEQAELVRYVEFMAHESPLPVYLYNMPRLTQHWFSLDTLRYVMQFETVVGVKDSSGDAEYFKMLCDLAAERPDWSIFIGSDARMMDAVRMGAAGGVCGGSNVAPALFVEGYKSAVRNDEHPVFGVERAIHDLGSIYQCGAFASGTIRGIKCALESMGICSGRMADPLVGCDSTQQSFIATQLATLGLLGLGETVQKRANLRCASKSEGTTSTYD